MPHANTCENDGSKEANQQDPVPVAALLIPVGLVGKGDLAMIRSRLRRGEGNIATIAGQRATERADGYLHVHLAEI